MDRKTALYILGLPTTADTATIKKRYRELIKKVHPDIKNGDAQLFIVIQETYQFLLEHKTDYSMFEKENIVNKKRREAREKEKAETSNDNVSKNKEEKNKTRIHVDNMPECEEVEDEHMSQNTDNKHINEKGTYKIKVQTIDKNKNRKNAINTNSKKNLQEPSDKNEENTESISYEEIIKNYSIEFSVKDLQEIAATDTLSKFYEINNRFYELVFTSGDVFYNINKKFYLKDTLIVKYGGQTKQYIIKEEISNFINTALTIDMPQGKYNVVFEFGNNKKTVFVNKKKKNFEKVIAIGNGFDSVYNDLLDLDTIMLKIILK